MAERKSGYKRGQKHIKNLRLYEVHKAGRSYWRLRTPDPSGTGFIERQFSSEAEALGAFELAYVQHHNHGMSAGHLGAKERGDAMAALDILRPFGVSLSTAARDYALRQKSVTESQTVKDAINALLTAKAKKRPRYRIDLKNRLGRFALDFGERKISEIEPPQVMAWLNGLGVEALTRDTYRLRLSTLWEFSRLHGWTTENIIREIPTESDGEGEIGILTVNELERLLRAASTETRPYWVLSAFTGLRSSELERISWSDIHWDAGQVVVPALKSKTASRRSIRLRENALAWLAPYRHLSEGQVGPRGLRWRLGRDRREAGLTSWKPNALRHSFCSYCLEAEKDLKTLAYEMGHTEPEVLYRHYREMVTAKAAQAYWSLVPGNVPPPNVIAASFEHPTAATGGS